MMMMIIVAYIQGATHRTGGQCRKRVPAGQQEACNTWQCSTALPVFSPGSGAGQEWRGTAGVLGLGAGRQAV
jgi:hypothetical protein